VTTSRTDFNETWLSEMPEGTSDIQSFRTLEFNIKDLKNNDVPVQDLGNGLKKVELSQVLHYWYEKDDIVLLGVELERQPQGLVVRLTGKNPSSVKKEPWASDLYDAVLKDQHRSVRILSDTQLTDQGYAIWKKLFDLGHKVSVYDRENPGRTFQTFTSSQDFDQYFKRNDPSFRRYQYILSESGLVLAETRGFFHTRRYRELGGLALND